MRSTLALVLALVVSPLSAQYINQEDQVRLLVPKPPKVQGVQKLLIMPGAEPASRFAAQSLLQELTRHGAIQAILLPKDHALAQRASAETFTPQEREALGQEFRADHALWLQLGRYKHKGAETAERIAHSGTVITLYKQTTLVSGYLEHSILPLNQAAITPFPAQQIAKDWVRESTNMRPIAIPQQECYEVLGLHAAKRLIQSVIEVQEIKPVPFFDGGEFKAAFAKLKKGDLEGSLGDLTTLQKTLTEASPKQLARLHYNLGVLQALKGETRQAVATLEKAKESGKELETIEKALVICRAAMR